MNVQTKHCAKIYEHKRQNECSWYLISLLHFDSLNRRLFQLRWHDRQNLFEQSIQIVPFYKPALNENRDTTGEDDLSSANSKTSRR